MSDQTAKQDELAMGRSMCLHRLTAFMAEQTEREAVVDWLRKTADSKPHGTDWRTYYQIADAIELGVHRP